ncbi:MAG: hypothetical protein ACYC5V_13855 [Gemmatimonadaceae bacterium]
MKHVSRRAPGYERNVFINCPFDDAYVPLLRPLLFTILDLGFTPRIASERSDSSENRLDKIVALIRASRNSIHDISRLTASMAGEFARFNLPFELGVDHGAQRFGETRFRAKRVLVLDEAPYDYRRALSDLSGVDIKHHASSPARLVRVVREWFLETAGVTDVPSPTVIWYRFTDFASAFYDERKDAGFSDEDLNFMPVTEYIDAIRRWRSRPV